MKVAWRIVLLVALVCGSGCHIFRAIDKRSCHEVHPYQRSQSVPPLIIPPGVDPPDTASALRLPQLKEPAPPPRGPKDPCLDEPPSFKVPQTPRVPQA
jgi:hypothetical protein